MRQEPEFCILTFLFIQSKTRNIIIKNFQSVHEAETSNETISVDSKKTDKGKKKKNKGKSKIKEQDNNKKKNTKKDLEDMKFLDGIIKQKNRQLRDIDQQNKKAVKEARKANKSVFEDNKLERQKIREIITKNDELLFQQSLKIQSLEAQQLYI